MDCFLVKLVKCEYSFHDTTNVFLTRADFIAMNPTGIFGKRYTNNKRLNGYYMDNKTRQ